MLDRFGQPIRVGYSEVEYIWLRAANMLDRHDRQAAFHDIVGMTGRTFEQIQDTANKLRRSDMEARISASRSIMVANRRLAGFCQPPAATPSDFKWPSQAAKMAGKAIARRRPEA